MDTQLCDLKKITVDDRLQLRGETDENLADEYANLMIDGVVFPPPVVFFDGTSRWLADGFTRYAAHKMAGKAGIKIELRKGSWDDAFRHAMGSNLAHGARPTNKHKHHLVMSVLAHPTFGQWSDREIAVSTGTSHTFVAQMRNPQSTDKKAAKAAGEPATPRDKPTSKPGIQIVEPTGKTLQSVENGNVARNSQVIHNPPSEADQGGDSRETILAEEVERLTARLALGAAEGYTDEEKGALAAGMEELQRAHLALQAERDSIASQRDAYMRECSELKSEVKKLRKKLDQALAKV